MLKNSSVGRACNPVSWRSGLAAILILVASPARAALTGAGKLASVYELILSADFDGADAVLKTTCPPAPAEACKVLEVVSVWWRIAIDPDNHSLDQLLNERARVSINAAEAWTGRAPKSAEAWFYLASAYAPLVQWEALRGERLSATRNANRIRE